MKNAKTPLGVSNLNSVIYMMEQEHNAIFSIKDALKQLVLMDSTCIELITKKIAPHKVLANNLMLHQT